MLISELLKGEKQFVSVENEREVQSLGLVGYTSGKDTCVFIENEKYVEHFTTNIKMVITNERIARSIRRKESSFGIVISDEPRILFFKLHNIICERWKASRKNSPTAIGEGCEISRLASISDVNVKIGNGVVIEEFVSIKEDVEIGDNSVIRTGSVIGGQGYEVKKEGGKSFFVDHIGKVIIGNHVEIKYNTCIDKAIYPWDITRVGDYSKIDNLVHIAHGVKIGTNTFIVANAGIGGRVTLGNNVWIGLGAAVRNGLIIGDNSRVNMGAVVTKDVDEGASVTGNFAIEHNLFLQELKCKMKDG